MFMRLCVRAFICVSFCLFFEAAGFAQNGQITGRVTDQNGAAIVHASVKAINQETLVERTTASDESGSYAVRFLPPGRYQIVVQAQGFSIVTSPDLRIVEGKDAVFNVGLFVQQSRTDVVVSSGSPAQIELESNALTGTLSAKEVTSFGLNGRNFTQLITLTPGVSNQTGQDEAKVGVAGSAKFSVNGGRVEYNTFEVDGSDVLNTSINASRGQAEPLIVYPSVDAIQDIQVLTSNYSAQYGKSASGSVLVSTKSGTRDLHGNLYEFLRNEAFNARNYFDQTKHAPLYRRHDFGGTVGGPVFIPNVYNQGKDKMFFFFSEEVRLEKTPVQYNQGTPTLAQRSGDFSDVCPPLGASGTFQLSQYPDCPSTFQQETAVVAFGAIGRQYPTPTSTQLLSSGIIPLPNANTGCNSTMPVTELHCYVASPSPATSFREELFRIDDNVTAKQLLSFRYIHDGWNTTVLTPQWGLINNSFPTVQNKLTSPGLDLSLNLTQTLPRGFFNRIDLSYAVSHITLRTAATPGINLSRSAAGIDDPCHTVDYPLVPPINLKTSITIPVCPLGSYFPGSSVKDLIPGLFFNGSNPAYGGSGFAVNTGYAPWQDATPTYQLKDDASKTLGKHTLQAGLQVIYAQQNEDSGVNGANTGATQGNLLYSNQLSPRSSNNAFADFLGNVTGNVSIVGAQVTALQGFEQDSSQQRYYNRYRQAELYLQDTWRATSRLTLNAGVRVSLFGTWYNAKGQIWNWEPGAFNATIANSVSIGRDFPFLISEPQRAFLPLDSVHPDPVLTNGLVHCGVGGVPKSCQQSDIVHPAPRLGFAWDPKGNGKSSIRGGYGIFWEHGTSSESNVGSLVGNPPSIFSVQVANSGSSAYVPRFDCIGGGAFSGPTGPVDCANQGGTVNAQGQYLPAAVPISLASIPTKAKYAYIQQWSFSVQRDLGNGLVGLLAYAGTKGTHLSAQLNQNQLRPLSQIYNPFGLHEPIGTGNCLGDGADYPVGIATSPSQPYYLNLAVACYGNLGVSGRPVPPNAFRPYRGFNQIATVQNVAASSYHGLQASLRKTQGKLDIGVAYTYSHSLDDASDRYTANFVDFYNLSQNKGSSDFDQRHILNVSYIYDLSLRGFLRRLSGWDAGDSSNLYKAKPGQANWIDTGAAKALLDSWQLSGITVWETGNPFTVVNAGGSNGLSVQDNAGVAYGLNAGSYPDVSGNPKGAKPAGGRNGQSFGPLLLNPGAFVAPRGLTYGNAGRNSLNNPTRTNFNLALLKHFKAFGDSQVEFRAEAFNLFNHTQFRIYDAAHTGKAGNNVINCYGGTAAGYSAAGGDGADCLTGNSFLHPIDAHDPRILQMALKLAF